ncbi:hypothetical protein diail_362 [Diaporthe ilicicola]|nr:hypothetical protein diail_362 [Diaporthe ilicicola]
MRFILALAALVAAASALPSAHEIVSNHVLTTREDFAEDDFEISAEPDSKKRQVGWPEVNFPGGGSHFIQCYLPPVIPIYMSPRLSPRQDDFEIGVPAALRFKDKKTRDTDGFAEDDFDISPEADDD